MMNRLPRHYLKLVLALALLGVTPAYAQADTRSNNAAGCPPEKPPVVSPAVDERRASLSERTWAELPGWGADNLLEAWSAFLHSCSVLKTQIRWAQVCALATDMPQHGSAGSLQQFFQQHFTPYQVINGDGTQSGLFTGYYEPLLFGSRQPTPRHRYPLYGAPKDLLVVDLGELFPELKNKRVRGRLEGNRIVPYYSRREIERESTSPLQGGEIAWLEDMVESFFLHIQGSGRIQLEDGGIMRVGYADQNGHQYRSLGRALIDAGELVPGKATMPEIKAWALRNPDKVKRFLDENPSYVFFRELPNDLPGPIGTLGVPLTPERSIAVDPRVIPLGAPVYLTTTYPNSDKALNRLVMAQDTGGAITGAVRADYFWGFGQAAGEQAGVMRQSGKLWVLLPKELPPPHE